jgi:hypothetical protein
MRTGTIATLLSAAAFAANAQQPPPATQPATRPAPGHGPASMADVEVIQYPALHPAAHWGLRYLARQQSPAGGWGQKYRVVQPNTDILGMGGKDFVKGPLPFDKKVLAKSPGIVDTSLVVLDFLEAGRSPARGDGAKELRKAIDFVHDAVGPGAQTPPPYKPPTVVRIPNNVPGILKPNNDTSDPFLRYAVIPGNPMPKFEAASGGVFNPAMRDAMALEMLLAARGRIQDQTARQNLDLTLAVLVNRVVSAQQADGSWGVSGPAGLLADAVVLRTLMIAARHEMGLTVDPDALARARASCLRTYDPTTGDSGDDSPHAFLQCALTLNVLYQTEQSARVAADRATRAAKATDRFFAKLFKLNKPVPKPRAAAVAASALPATRPANPLEARNPLEATAAQEKEETREVGIPVPVSHANAVAYFLLLESLKDSTHPLARPLANGVVNALASKQDRFGQWHVRVNGGLKIVNHTPQYDYDKEDHFLTAWVVRTILLPPPPEPDAKK